MPFFELRIQADLQGIEALEFARDPQDSSLTLFAKLECQNCRQETSHFVAISDQEQMEMTTSRGTANLVIRCKECKREHSVSVTSTPVPYKKSGQEVSVGVIECRGVVPTAWEPINAFLCRTEGGKTFEARFEDGDWAEYDEDAEREVGVYGLKGRWALRAKP